jgi:hypothetical protein
MYFLHNGYRIGLTLALGVWSVSLARADSDLRKEQVPAAVHQQFKQDYPKARSIEYELEIENGQRVYEIDFKVGRRKVQAHYREHGTVIRVDRKQSDDDD